MIFRRLQNHNNRDKDHGSQNKCRLGPTIDAKKILTEPMLTSKIFQGLLKSKDHLNFINYKIYI